MKRQKMFSMCLIAIVLALGTTAKAQWSSDPTQNTRVSPITAVGHQVVQDIISDECRGAIIVWVGGGGTFVQRLDVYGIEKWRSNGIEVCSAGVINAKMVSDGIGGAIIAFERDRDIYAQHVDANGNVIWEANGVPICTLDERDRDLSITSDGKGGAIIVWDSGGRIRAQRVNGNGDIQWPTNGVTVVDAEGPPPRPQVISDGDGGAIIAWAARHQLPDTDIFAQRLNANGVTIWQEYGVSICAIFGSQYGPRLISDGSGGAIIVWEDQRSDEGDIRAQRVVAAGHVSWMKGGVRVCTASNAQYSPKLTPDGSDGAIITWRDERRGTGEEDIYTQQIDSDGNVQWDENGIPISTTPGLKSPPDIVADGSGGAVICWIDNRDFTGSGERICAQRVNTYGHKIWLDDGKLICSAPFRRINVHMTDDCSGGAILAWDDIRAGDYTDVYAQQTNRDGELGIVIFLRIKMTGPDANQINVLPKNHFFAYDIYVIFDQRVDPATVNANSFIVMGSQTGLHAGTFSSEKEMLFRFDCDEDFAVGETVTVTLTTGIRSVISSFGLEEPYIFSFMIEATKGTGMYSEAGGSPYYVGDEIGNVVTADFDNDCVLDLAIPCGLRNDIVVYKRKADGTYRVMSKSFWTGGKPGSLAVGDFNRDGKIDLVVCIWNQDMTTPGFVSILIGNGDCTFKSPVTYQVGIGPNSVQSGDFNGDGNPDLAVNSHFDNNVSVLLGNGDGTFQAHVTYSVDGYPRALTIGDFNLDNKLDIAMASGDNTSTEPGCGPGQGTMLLGNGDGTFTNRKTFDPGEGPFHMAIGDFNEDYILDFVIANEDGDGGTHSEVISVLLGNGDGTFGQRTEFRAYEEPRAVTVGDFFKDGHLDIAVATFNRNIVSVLLGVGNGNFSQPYHFETGDGPNSIVSGDFDGDGSLDFTTSNYRSENITILLEPPGLTCIPEVYDLSQNYPNPFNPGTIMHYQIPENGHVIVKIFNLLGPEIKTLVNEHQRRGHYFIHWDGRDNSGMQVQSGVYLYRIQTKSFVSTKKMTVLR